MRADEFIRLVERCDVRNRRAIVFDSKGGLCEASRIDCLTAVLDAIMRIKERGPTLHVQDLRRENTGIYLNPKNNSSHCTVYCTSLV